MIATLHRACFTNYLSAVSVAQSLLFAFLTFCSCKRKMIKAAKDDRLLQVNERQIKLVWKILHLLMTMNNEELKFDWVKHIDDLHVFASASLALCHEGILFFLYISTILNA